MTISDAIRNNDAATLRSIVLGGYVPEITEMDVQMAAAIGNEEVISLLMVDQSTQNCLLRYAVEIPGRPDVVRCILKNSSVRLDLSPAMLNAIRHRSFDNVKILCSDNRMRVTYHHLGMAVMLGEYKMVKYFLKKYPYLDTRFAMDEQKTMVNERKYDKIMKLLKEHVPVREEKQEQEIEEKPKPRPNTIMGDALQRGDVNQVQSLILQDLRVRVEVYRAVGNTEMLRMVLRWMDPSEYENFAIQVASHRGYLESVRMLMADRRVDPSCRNNRPLEMAKKRDHFYVVSELLRSARVRALIVDRERFEQEFFLLGKDYLEQVRKARALEYSSKEHLRSMCRYNPRMYDKNPNADLTKEEQIDAFVEEVYM